MKQSEFIDGLKEALELEEELEVNTTFKKLAAYDSLTNLILIAYIDQKFKKKFSAKK